MRLEIEDLAGGGAGLGRAGGRSWFVAGALPGELVEAREVRRRAGIVEAVAERVLRPSPEREPDPCPVAGACGGCDLAHLRRDAAGAALRRIAAGALRHAPPALTAAVAAAPVVVSPMGWRLRVRLHWDPGPGILGFFGRLSHRAVAIDPCRVVSPLLLEALPALRGALTACAAPPGDVEWLETLDGGTAVAGWWGEGPAPQGPLPPLAGWHLMAGRGAGRGWGAAEVTMALPVPLTVPLGAFFQGNRHLVPRLFDRVAVLVGESGATRAVDLYGGVGLLAAAAATGGARAITVVEGNPVAARAAASNLPSAEVVPGSAEAFLRRAGGGDGVVALVDPPRTGLSAEARRRILVWAPEVIVMLSCDPGRFGRDAAALVAAGYGMELVELWDLFGGSHHVEVLARFRRHGT